MGAAIFAFATGFVTLQDIPTAWAVVWNASFTLISLIVISLTLDEAGFFRWLALLVARAAMGNGRVLFALVVLLGALVSAVLTNYGTALIWTPTVLEILLLLGFSPRAILPFVFATGFIADAASLPLPISNLVNLLSTDILHISFLRYVLVMVPVNFLAIATSLAVFWYYFNRHIPLTYNLNRLPLPATVIRDPLICQWSFAILGLLFIGYWVAQAISIPVSLITAIAAFIMLVLALRWSNQNTHAAIPVGKVLRQAPWQIILLTPSLYLVVIGLRSTGITTVLSNQLESLSIWGLTLSTVGIGFVATLLSGVMNNLPTLLINAQVLQELTGIDHAVREVMVYANVIGCNIGAKITPIGSLSTLLWMNILARKGFRISWVQYVHIAVIVTLPVLFISLLCLAIWLPWLIA